MITFITLTTLDEMGNDQKLLVSPLQITAIKTKTSGSVVCLTGGATFDINENADVITEKVADAIRDLMVGIMHTGYDTAREMVTKDETDRALGGAR